MFPVGTAYWKGTQILIVIAWALLVLRINELVPHLGVVKPTLIFALLATAVSAARVKTPVWGLVKRERATRHAFHYFLWCAAMVPFSVWKGKSVEIVQALPFGLLVVALFVLARPDRRLLDFVTFWTVVAGAVLALIVLANNRTTGEGQLTTGGAYDPNDLAAVASFSYAMALGVGMRPGPWLKRVVAFGAAGLLAWTVIRSGSRGGFIALAVGSFTLLLGLNFKRLFLMLALGCVAAPFAWSVAPPTFRTRVESLTHLEDDYNTTSTAGRKYIWKRGLVFFAHSPLIGAGPGGYETRMGQDFKQLGITGSWHTAHNTYVQVLVELGAPGGFLLGSMLAVAVVGGWGCWRPPGRYVPWHLHRPEILAATTSFMASAFFLSHAYVYFTFGIVGLGVLTQRVLRAESIAHGFGPVLRPRSRG